MKLSPNFNSYLHFPLAALSLAFIIVVTPWSILQVYIKVFIFIACIKIIIVIVIRHNCNCLKFVWSNFPPTCAQVITSVTMERVSTDDNHQPVHCLDVDDYEYGRDGGDGVGYFDKLYFKVSAIETLLSCCLRFPNPIQCVLYLYFTAVRSISTLFFYDARKDWP